MIALHVLFGLVALFWAAAFARAVRSRGETRFRVRPDEPPLGAAPRLTVVVPARDEVANIEGCVRAVLAQDLPGLRAVVLDDGSTDGTGEVLGRLAAAEPRLRVVNGGGGPLPDGWLGKPWACMRAARAAFDLPDPPDWLLFVDADVRLAPRAASASLAYALRNELAMVSGLGRFDMRTFWEKTLQPAVGGLIIAGNDLARNNDPARRRGDPLANGQFILLRRDAWEAVGGHEAVRACVLDDVGLATAVTAKGFPYHLVFMRDLFSCRMYTSLAELWNGWSKNLFVGLGRRWSAVVFVTVFIALTAVLPYAGVVAGFLLGASFGWTALAAVVLLHAVRLYLDRVFGQEAIYGLTHLPAAVMLVALILHSAARTSRGRATWKGRVLAGS